MSRPRSGIGAELAPLVLILACLAGSLALIVMVHRRATSRPPSRPAVAVALPPAPVIARPTPDPVAVPEPDEPEPPPPPAPEDPTPKVLAKHTAAEADQLLEASRADRKAEAIEAANKAALAESERWRRRESLVRLQLDTLDSKVRKLEVNVDELALERDALERELDARKALAARDRSRPGQAILPHRGQNGTWRRPIVVECSNGMAILRPQGLGFGLLDLASGFGPASNPFVAAVAREAIRIQGNRSPDGQVVIPYIFFLVRPDGIRAYYEARGRLEPLGITFGYELADQDWEVDFPDLDDVKTWDGSAPSRPEGPDPLAQVPGRAPGSSPAEDEEFPSWGSRRGGRSGRLDDAPGDEFAWPSRSRAMGSGGRANLGNPRGSSGSGPIPGLGDTSGDRAAGPAGLSDLGDPLAGVTTGGPGRPVDGPSGSRGIGPGSGLGASSGDPPPGPAPRELSLGRGPARPLDFGDLDPPGRPSPYSTAGGPAPESPGPQGPGSPPPALPAPAPPRSQGLKDSETNPKDDPANAFVWPSKPEAGPRGAPRTRPGQPSGGSSDPVANSPPIRHLGPFSRPLAMGIDSLASSSPPASSDRPGEGDPSQPDGFSSTGSADASRSRSGSSGATSRDQGRGGSPSDARGIGQGGPPNAKPPRGTIGVGMPGMPSMTSPPSSPPGGSDRSPSIPGPGPSSIIDRRFEIVVVCSARGVIVQPGSYRVTADALKDRDGLLKKQMVALVKAKRSADPKTTIEPRVRFLVQPGGDKTYWAARGQFLLSGLDWPVSTHVSDPDHPSILPSESW